MGIVHARLVRFPEGELVDPVGLLHEAVGKAERLEHLQAVGLLLDDAGNAASCAAGGAAADDQDVDLLGQPIRGAGRLMASVSLGDIRVAGLEPVEVELHRSYGFRYP